VRDLWQREEEMDIQTGGGRGEKNYINTRQDLSNSDTVSIRE